VVFGERVDALQQFFRHRDADDGHELVRTARVVKD
jgi:hypothetical protein